MRAVGASQGCPPASVTGQTNAGGAVTQDQYTVCSTRHLSAAVVSIVSIVSMFLLALCYYYCVYYVRNRLNNALPTFPVSHLK